MRRDERVGVWISGLAHSALVIWAITGGALFGARELPPAQRTEITTITPDALARLQDQSRGAGPVGQASGNAPVQPLMPSDTTPNGVADPGPDPTPDANVPARPQVQTAPETAPDVTEIARRSPPVEVETVTPSPEAPAPEAEAPPPVEPMPAPERAAPPEAPLPPRPNPRPEALAAEAEAARQAELERQREAAAEAARRAEAEAEAARQAELERQREAAAEAARRVEAEAEAARQAELERQREAEAEAARRAEAEAEAARQAELERQREAEAEAARRAEAEAARQAELERQRAEEARAIAEAQAALESRQPDALTQALEEAMAAPTDGNAAEGEGEGGGSDVLTDALNAALGAKIEEDPLDNALADAMGRTRPSELEPATDVIATVPMTAAEKESFRQAVQRCWNPGALSADAAVQTVVLGFAMDQSGRPAENSFRLIAPDDAEAPPVRAAFDAVRRAVLRCAAESGGYTLPPEKYNEWDKVEITFGPGGVGDIR